MKTFKALTITLLILSVGTVLPVARKASAKDKQIVAPAATLKLAKITNGTDNKIKISYTQEGIPHSINIPSKTSVDVDNTPNLMIISHVNVDLTPERRYITAPAQTDAWDKLFVEKRMQLKDKKQSGTHNVELKIMGADSLELVNAPLNEKI